MGQKKKNCWKEKQVEKKSKIGAALVLTTYSNCDPILENHPFGHSGQISVL